MTSGKVFIEQGGEAIVLSTQSKSFMAVNDMLYGFEHVLPLLLQVSLSMLKNSRLCLKGNFDSGFLQFIIWLLINPPFVRVSRERQKGETKREIPLAVCP